MPPALMVARGLMLFIPVYFGALPPMGSNMDTPSGLMLPPAAMPRPQQNDSDQAAFHAPLHTTREYQGTKQNESRCLRRDERAGESLVCMGWEPLPGDGECDNVCFAEICISPTKGVVTLTGTWAPNYGSFVRDGYRFVPAPPAQSLSDGSALAIGTTDMGC